MKKNEMQIFSNQEFGEIRTYVEADGSVTFCGADAARALGYSNTQDALSRHCKDPGVVFHEVGVRTGTKKDGSPAFQTVEMKFITRGNLVRLIAGSHLPDAEKFESWIFDEVIPTVLEHGAYATDTVIEQVLSDPDFGIRLLSELKEERDKRRNLEVKNSALTVDNQIMKPKAEYFDELVDRSLLTNFRETAAELGLKERQFISFLLDKKYVYRDRKGKLMPYAAKNDGLFEQKERFNEKTQWSGTQTLITPKGRETFRLLWFGK